MSTFFKVLLVILIILVIALVVLYFVGRKMQRKQAAQQEQMEAAKQSVSMLVIDKKIMPLKQSGLPQIVIDQTPKLMRRSKLPIVKAKVGPRIMTLVADSAIFDTIPVKKEIKAVISGIYIMEVRGVRGPLDTPPKKKSMMQKLRAKLTKAEKELQQESTTGKKSKKKSKEVKKEPDHFTGSLFYTILFCLIEVLDEIFHLRQQTVHSSVVSVIVQRIVHLCINRREHFPNRLNPFLTIAVLVEHITAALILFRRHLLQIYLYVWLLTDIAVGNGWRRMVQKILQIVNIAGGLIVSPRKSLPHRLCADGSQSHALACALEGTICLLTGQRSR